MEEKLLLTTDIAASRSRALPIQLADHKNILMIVDGLLVVTALTIGLWLGSQLSAWTFGWELILAYSPWFAGITALYFVLAIGNDAYQPKVASDPVAGFLAILKTIFQILLLYLVIYFLLPPYSLPRHFIGFFTIISPLFLLSWRRLYSWAFTMPAFQHKVIIVGAGWAGETIAKTLKDFAPSHYRVIGFVDDDPTKQQGLLQGLPVLGPTTALPELIQIKKNTDIVLAINRDVPGHILGSLLNCYEQNVRVSTMPELYERLTSRVPVEHIGDNWFVMLPLSNKGQNLLYRIAARGIDVCISVVGLMIFAPMVPLLAAMIATDSPGPVFYRQTRVGRAGNEFEIIKLRSMVADAERDGQAKWADTYDKRVTRVGRFLRQTRLDEVPQLLNVLRGEMSLVGPRPERPEFVGRLEQEIPFYRTRLTVKPGLTGWAQVNYDYGRNVVDALEKLRYDLYYIKHQSIHLDLVILLKTVSTILRLKGT